MKMAATDSTTLHSTEHIGTNQRQQTETLGRTGYRKQTQTAPGARLQTRLLCAPEKAYPRASECVQSQTIADHLISKTEEHDLSMQMSTQDVQGLN